MSAKESPRRTAAASPGPAGVAVALLRRATAEARRAGREDLAARLDAQRARVTDPAYQLLVVGEFKKGKSALVNALLNVRACPVDADLATAVPTVVRYGPRMAAAVVAGDGTDGDPRPLPLTALDETVTEQPAGAAAERAGHPHSVEVQAPRALLRQGLVLVDTPGVGGGLAAAHAGATLRALAWADAVLFVTDASQELAEPELAFLKRAAGLCPNVLCVLTKTDFYPEWRRILELDRGHLRRAGLELDVLPLAAPLRHHALRTGDRDLNLRSGYPQLAARIRRQVQTDRETVTARTAASVARSALSQLLTTLVTERAALADPSGGAGTLAQIERLRERAEKLRGSAARWQQTLNDRFGDMTSNIDMDLSNRLLAIRREADKGIESSDPAKVWGELQGWLYERTNDELSAHHGAIRDQAAAVAAEVARHFGSDAGDLAFPEVGAGAGAPAVSALRTGRFERLSRGELALLTMRSSTSGFVIASMVGTFGGILLSPVAALLVPVGGVLALAMGRTSARQATEARRKANRAEATRAVHAYLEEAAMVARKDSRDALRRVHQDLRDTFTAHAEELHTSVKQSLENAARAAKADRATRTRRLEETEADVTRLRALLDAADRLLGAVPDEPATGTR